MYVSIWKGQISSQTLWCLKKLARIECDRQLYIKKWVTLWVPFLKYNSDQSD